MTLRAKLATTIAALCMVICLLTVGVLAFSTVTVNLNGNVSFTADDVHAKVEASTTGTTEGTAKSDSVVFNCSATAATDDNKTASDTFDFSGMIFENKETDIKITIKVSNLGERALTATVAKGTVENANDNITVTIDNEEATNVEATTGTATFTVTLHIVDTNETVKEAPFAIVVTLVNVADQAND